MQSLSDSLTSAWLERMRVHPTALGGGRTADKGMYKAEHRPGPADKTVINIQ